MADRAWRIEASAPGKLVVSGEYAVLAGAPALVAAVDRRVTCVLSPREAGGWHFVSRGFVGDETLSKEDVFRTPPTVVAGIARRAIAEAVAPRHLHIAIDSSPCYRHGVKLGVGSSAALVTAVAAAFGALGDDMPRLSDLYDIHADLQGGGSGLDIAAAVTGGVIRFQHRRASPARLPAGLHTMFVFVGASTRTSDLVDKFETWRGGSVPPALERLAAAAAEVADCTVNAETFVAALGDYADVLERFDRAARIGILGPGHVRARKLAADRGVVYKPCGAGGGDTGMAVAVDAAALAAFGRDVETEGLTMVPMEISPNGVTVLTR